MSTVEVVFVTEGNCPNCNSARAVLAKLRHEYRHLAIDEIHPDALGGRAIDAEIGIPALPALVVKGRLRLVEEITEKQIRRELEKAKAHRTR